MVEWYSYVLIAVLTILSGLCSGLNLGYLGLDPKHLELLTIGPFETKEDEISAKRKEHLLLCTILLGNVAINASLSILMADLTSGLIGLIVSTGLIVIFGEITPQAICSRYGLQVGYYFLWLIYFFIILTLPIAYPLSLLLQKILGNEQPNVYTKNRMKKLFEMYERENLLHPSERKILTAALELHEKQAKNVMTPLDQTFMLDIDTVITKDLLKQIYLKGYSRIPVYQDNRSNIVGILMSRELILVNPDRALITIKQLQKILIKYVVHIDEETQLDPILSFFKRGQTHMGVVTRVQQHKHRDPEIIRVGIITLEDIISEVLKGDKAEEQQFRESKRRRQQLKERLMLLFHEQLKGQAIMQDEIIAISEFLSKQSNLFKVGRNNKHILTELISRSEIIEIESDDKPYIHKPQSTCSSSLKSEKIDNKAITKNQIRVDQEIEVVKQNSESLANQNEICLYPKRILDPILFKKGELTDCFYLLLQGNVCVCSGKEDQIVNLQSFSLMGQEALSNNFYRPDFSAKVIKYARLMRIKRKDYQDVMSLIK